MRDFSVVIIAQHLHILWALAKFLYLADCSIPYVINTALF